MVIYSICKVDWNKVIFMVCVKDINRLFIFILFVWMVIGGFVRCMLVLILMMFCVRLTGI